MYAKTICNKCGKQFYLDFGDMPKEEATRKFHEMDKNGFQCPGHHVELGGVFDMWNLNETLHRVYVLGETEELSVPTDEEYVKALLAEGKDMVDGGANKVPELNLLSIHSIPGLLHKGFGEFESATHRYIRRDSPVGTRFYERVVRQDERHAM